MQKIRIGGGAGFSGDRLEPAVLLAREGKLDYLVLECLAERTIALAQQRKLQDPSTGFDPLLERRMESLLPVIKEHGVRLISNFGAANPVAAARKIAELAKRKGISITVAAVFGDDVLEQIDPAMPTMETGRPLSDYGDIISANAYLGIDALLPALESGAEVIVTGRVADPSLFLAPMVHAFGWSVGDYATLGQGTVIGHLLECGAQICGGYFMDGDRKAVPDPARLGFPIAEVAADGSATISKIAGTGGRIDLRTAKEQLLYEVVDPHAYLTPDVAADFTTVHLQADDTDIVSVYGGTGVERPDTLKASVGYRAGYRGEGEISYAGPGAESRARLAGEIVAERLQGELDHVRVDIVGVDSVHLAAGQSTDPREARVRVSGSATTREIAARVGEEVEALYTNGPWGGGGARKTVTQMVGIVSVLLDRKRIHPSLEIFRA
ncbi:acyclic terpene utilization AtuA family protein [Lewinella sp. IMCC34191]|uniref:acyclic terpene utilization AtuA family protein n=1 Tax=Lewinella sp. IMCC34191 TaxID=2259172 RepID=UPI000E24290E|nr:acyclic terpene utilization AtuA family protein [Lewinella sp. IMCC34191]